MKSIWKSSILLGAIFALLLGINSFAMDATVESVGTKRSLPTEVVEEIQPAAKEGRVEEDKAGDYLFSQFDEPTQAKIRSYLETGNGFGLEKLYSAAANMRNLRLVSKADRALIDDPEFIEKLIPFLAQKYTNNNRVKVVLALHTKSAADWLNAALLQEAGIYNFGVRILDKQVTNELIDQLNQGHVDAARFLLNASKVPNQDNYMLRFAYANASNRDTLLIAAAKAGDLPLFTTILAHSDMPTINHMNNDDDETALIAAIKFDRTPIALALLRAGANPIIVNNDDIEDTALFHASLKNNTELVQELLLNPEVKQAINFRKYSWGATSIKNAVNNNNEQMFKMLIGVPHIELGDSLLHNILATSTAMTKEFVAKIMSENETNPQRINAADLFGLFNLDEAGEPDVTDIDAKDRLLLLLPLKPDLNIKEDSEISLLMRAVFQSKMRTIESLLRAGVDVNLVDENGETALDYAYDLETDNKDRIIKMLIAAGAKRGAQK